MAQQLADRVKETTTTTGTGPLTLAGAMTGFRPFSSICSVGDTAYYALQAVDSNGNPTGAWEVGLGTYSAANTLTRTTILASSTGSVISLAAGTTQVWMDLPAAMFPGGRSMIPGYINGFALANDATTPNTVLDIGAGYAADGTNAVMISGTALAKSISSTWASGSGAGGLGAGLTLATSTWYHVFAIINSGAYDVYFDTSPAAANAPTGTTAFRYIGSFKTNASSTVIAFKQYGQTFLWNAPPIDLSGGGAATETPITLSTPLGFVATALMRYNFVASLAGSQAYLYTLSPAVITAVVTAFSANINTTGAASVQTNTSSQIGYVSSASTPLTIWTLGYINPHVAPTF